MATSECNLIIVKRLSENARLPIRGSSQSAGYDLSSAMSVVIPAQGKGLVKTDLAMIIPKGCYGRIAPRSGLAWKKHIHVGAGVIDRDYRGNVGVVMFNHSRVDLQINTGDRIAQLLLEKIGEYPVIEVHDLTEQTGGTAGFEISGENQDVPLTDSVGEPQQTTITYCDSWGQEFTVKQLSKNAKLPIRRSVKAAGYDLTSATDILVPARGKALVKTDLSMIIPKGCYGRIAPRRGLAEKKHIDVGAGVIDPDYRGNVEVVLFNHAETDFAVSIGDCVAQIILEQISETDILEVQDLTESQRGSGGFGSTGVSKRPIEEVTNFTTEQFQKTQLSYDMWYDWIYVAA